MAEALLPLSVVVPVRNEAGNIRPLLAEIHTALAGAGDYEVIYVDDGSTDATAGELAGLQDPRLQVVTHRVAVGQSQATLSGALAARGTWIATLDGDGQNDPADLPKLLGARDGAGSAGLNTLFIGRRNKRQDDALRLVASRIANAVRRTLLGDATLDSGCGLKLIRRDLLLALPRFDALHRFMPALVLRAGGQVMSVPTGHRPRLRGRSKYGIIGRGVIGIVDLLGVFWLLRRHSRPDVVKKETS